MKDRSWIFGHVVRCSCEVLETLFAASALQTLTLDVVVPTYRCDVQVLRKIRDLRVPSGVATTFIFIIDDPAKDQVNEIKNWESLARPLGSV